jgi:antibiotic biosynthesis monooxygenase (ABM) superfamily enzyme
MNGKPVTVSITRTVKAGHEAEFERALHDFVQRSLVLPGQLGVHVMRPVPGSSSREYGIVRKFGSREDLAAFRESPEFLDWTRLAADLTEGSQSYDELCGLESWFTPPGSALVPLPRWKMALATFLGVYPVASLLGLTLAPAIHSWPVALRNAAFNACVVVLLTWFVMPLITRLLHPWLHSNERKPNS